MSVVWAEMAWSSGAWLSISLFPSMWPSTWWAWASSTHGSVRIVTLFIWRLASSRQDREQAKKPGLKCVLCLALRSLKMSFFWKSRSLSPAQMKGWGIRPPPVIGRSVKGSSLKSYTMVTQLGWELNLDLPYSSISFITFLVIEPKRMFYFADEVAELQVGKVLWSNSQHYLGTFPHIRLPSIDLLKNKKLPLERRCKFNSLKTTQHKALWKPYR